jgi:hypothetical protein
MGNHYLARLGETSREKPLETVWLIAAPSLT